MQNNLVYVEIENREYGRLTDPLRHHTAPNFNLHISKLMPFVPFGTTNSWQTRLNSNGIFANDLTKSPISHSSSITKKNHITVNRHLNIQLGESSDDKGYHHQGKQFLVDFINSNIHDFKVDRVVL